MKYKRLVVNTTPYPLQEWLGKELEDRGIDSVYARSVLSLLQQDYIDIDPHDCNHGRSQRLKELHKGGPGKSNHVTKSKHQKWRTRDMQIQLTTTYPCCDTVLPDFEKLKKKAAVDCLQSASDYINDIEELIDEVWRKLKNTKTLKGETEEKTLRKFKDPFFIPPSSPTDEIEKYFAAFPPLNDKVGAAAAIEQYELTENVWYKRCVSKRKVESKEEILHDSGSIYLRSPTKGCQPIIPYNSLKPIKNVYKIDSVVSETSVRNKKNQLVVKPKKMRKKANYETDKNVHPLTLYNRKLSVKSLEIAFDQLFIVTLNDCSIEKNVLQGHLQGLTLKVLCDALLNSVGSNFSLNISQLNSIIFNNKGLHEVEDVPKTTIPLNENVQPDNQKISLVDTVLESLSSSKISESNTGRDCTSNCLENHFELWNFDDTSTMNYVDITQSVLSSLSLCDDSNSWMLASSLDGTPNSFEPIYRYESENIFSEIGIPSTFSEYLYSSKNKNESYLDFSLWEPKTSAFQLIPGKTETSIVKGNIIPVLSPPKNNDSIEKLLLDLPSESNQILEEFPDKEIIKDEVFFSDDESPAFFSHKDENLFTSYKTHFQPISLSGSFSDLTDASDSDNKFEKAYETFKCVSDVQRNENLSIQNFLVDKTIEIAINKSESVSSSCEELSFFAEYQLERSYKPRTFDEFNNECSNSNLNNPSPYLPNLTKDETGNFESNNCLDKLIFELYDKKGLLHWGKRHGHIADIWQKECESATVKVNKDDRKSKVSSSLSLQIKKDGEELLKSLMAHVLDDSDKPLVEEFTESYTHHKPDYQFLDTVDSEVIYLESGLKNEQDTYNCSSKLAKFFIDSVETDSSEIDFSSRYQEHNFNSSFYNEYELSDAKPSSDNLFSYGKNYSEGGGWSLAHDNLFEFENSTDRANSLGDLNLENGAQFLELYHQNRRIRCTSDTNADFSTGNEVAMALFQKHSKQKYGSRKRPCCFFLQGTCTRSDCKFSHDLSNITCRFWKEGSCFKGDTCPFLHGYICEKEKVCENEYYLKPEDDDNKYSLESELDFPSLSSAQDKEPKEKSTAIDIKMSARKRVREG